MRIESPLTLQQVKTHVLENSKQPGKGKKLDPVLAALLREVCETTFQERGPRLIKRQAFVKKTALKRPVPDIQIQMQCLQLEVLLKNLG